MAEVRAEAPRLTLLTGLVPKDRGLVARWEEAQKLVPQPPEVGQCKAKVLYTDGSASTPEDPWLRRAGWGVVWRGEDGEWNSRVGPTPGRQSVARSELFGRLGRVLC